MASAAPPAPPKPPAKTSPDLPGSNSSLISVIIQYNTAPTSSELRSLMNLGGSTPVLLKSINAVQVFVPSSAISNITSDSNVRYVSPDRQLVTHAAPPPPGQVASIATNAEYTAEPINAPAVWAKGYVGTGVGVAVIDSGISVVRDLQSAPPVPGQPAPAPIPGAQGRVLFSYSFVPNEPQTNDPYGHGTHVAGLIGGNGAASYGNQFTRTFTGIAPNVNLVNLRVLDENGQGTDTSVIQAIEAAIALKSTYNIRVINLSLGRPIYESYTLDPLCQAVEQAWKAGIVVVAAAGNDGRDLSLNTEGYGTIEAPGNDPYVITVGAVNTNGTAVNTDDQMASYSSKGPSFVDQVAKPDIVAPGNLVTSLLTGGSNLQKENPNFFTPKKFYQQAPDYYQASPDYMPLSGTSMATGVASGAVALLLNANSSLTPDQVKALLMHDATKGILPATSTVVDSGNTYIAHDDVFTVGAGYLNIAAAVADAKANIVPTGTAMTPLATYDPASGNVNLVADSTALWGRTALWGASGVYGANAFVGGSTALWGRATLDAASGIDSSTALWGRDDPAAFTALWGATALWGRATPEAATALWGRTTPDASTALWGRSTTSASTALWGATTLNGASAMWGSSVFATQ